MSKEGDHHYVPQFHLKRWEGRDEKLLQWERIRFNNKLVRSPVTTAATAYVPGLYALEEVISDEVQQIETKVFGKIETEASPILEKLINQGASKLTVVERYWWTMYLNASVFRVPHVIARLKAEGAQIAERELSKDIDEFVALKGNAPEKTLFEWTKNHAPSRIANFGLKTLLRLLDNERAIDRIIHLQWHVRDVTAASRRLLLGDDPFCRVNDLYNPRTLIAMPLSPTRVFFGTDAGDIVRSVMTTNTPREIVHRMNVETLRKTRRFVYGDAERSFIEKYLPLHPQ
ncbi:DUF4238 domain-containing protein [Phyllobacterium sp. A18/5-2]|uniref:DUF4238 domain-containing protein n=1 Tax=Phyllobacterium sp. A18/5-2 TaxID=2978392 RepID=UPI0021C6FDD1|nr:DUF4238 domain-containing protein [Phyllobacterium sp. A18/5-2]UXN62931.1 DUF4238 domain-containing protein [Phyllobacterium sp. A18/5-2]